MKFKKLILFITFISLLLGENKRLSFDDVQGKSPFEYARLGMMKWLPDQNTYLSWGKDSYKGHIVSVKFPEQDTTVFVDSSLFYLNGKKLSVYSFNLDESKSKLLLLTKRKKIWRHSFYGEYFVLDLPTKTVGTDV